MATLKEIYKTEIIPKMQKEFNYTNANLVPRVTKITVNRSINLSKATNKTLDTLTEELTVITGQKPLILKAKKSISNFKLREGVPIACKVTLRGARMYDFLNKLINIVLPKIRDFKGVSAHAFDGKGNYNLGIKEQIVFPEIDFEKIESVHGMDISIETTARTDAEGKALLEMMGFPFRKS